ncbi:hypothetical protein B0H11DRAFT_2080885 [Mycena galericulata]|nr:hypothetical protein B0H11DRAFT_2080879 [Mycena galericulata]KAJ7448444.1 hypothetical protein B0H11DRAFT_2080885 [Mycena galericulata]
MLQPYHRGIPESQDDLFMDLDQTDVDQMVLDTQGDNASQLTLKFPIEGFMSNAPDNFSGVDLTAQGNNLTSVPIMASTSAPSSSQMAKSKKRSGASSGIFISGTRPKRSKRNCFKCGRDDCRGSVRKNLCLNPCADCKQISCEGRIGAHPGVPCSGTSWNLAG